MGGPRHTPPFHALAIYFDHCAGNRRYAPKVTNPCRPSLAPVIGEIYVGNDWDDTMSSLYPNGLRYAEWEMHSESCGPGLRSNKAGKVFLDLEESAELDVDEQAAADFLEFIAEEKIAEYHRPDCRDWTLGALTYLQIGICDHRNRPEQHGGFNHAPQPVVAAAWTAWPSDRRDAEAAMLRARRATS